MSINQEIYSFGYWLRRQRKALDLTQAEIGQQLGCSRAMIRKIEQDERRPSLHLAQRMADLFQLCEPQRTAFLRSARHTLSELPELPNKPAPSLSQGLVGITPVLAFRQSARKQHAHYYTHYTTQLEPLLCCEQRLLAMNVLDADMAHLKMVIQWTIDEKHDVMLGLCLLGSLCQFWHVRGYYQEASQWLKEGLENLPRSYDHQVVARAYMTLGYLAWFRRDYTLAQKKLLHALQFALKTRDIALQSEILSLSAISVLHATNDTPYASALSLQALELAEHAGSWKHAMALFWHSVISYRLHQPEHAYRSAISSWRIFEQTGDLWNVGPLSVVADIASDQGQYTQAFGYYRHIAEAFKTIEDQWGLAFSLRRLAEIQICRNEHEQAQQYAQQSLQRWRQLGDDQAANRIIKFAQDHALSLE